MSYLTDAEQIEIKEMENLFASEGFKIFLERAGSPEHIAMIQAQYSTCSNERELGFLQGQERVIKQLMGFKDNYQTQIDAIEEQRADEAKIAGIEKEEDNLANA